MDEEYRSLVGNCILYTWLYTIYYIIILYVSHCIAVIVDDDHWCAVDEYPASCGRLTVWLGSISIHILLFHILNINRHTFLHIYTIYIRTNIYSHTAINIPWKLTKLNKKLFFPLQIENIITPLLLTVITAYRVQHILLMFYSAVSNIGHNQQTNCASCASISIGNPWQLTNAQWTDGDCRSVSISTIVCWEHSSMAEW